MFCRKVCSVFTLTLVLTSESSVLPSYVTLMDRCEDKWRTHSYVALYDEIDDWLKNDVRYLPYRFCLASRYRKYGCRYEDEIGELKSIVDSSEAFLCETHPELRDRVLVRIRMSEHDVATYNKLGYGVAFRSEKLDPRNKPDFRNGESWELKVFMDVPFLVPNIRAWSNAGETPVIVGTDSHDRQSVVGDQETLLTQLASTKIGFQAKKMALDCYIDNLVTSGGVRTLVRSLSDSIVRLDGYHVLEILRNAHPESFGFIKAYIESPEVDASFCDNGLRMAIWALLQFAHDDAEVADYLHNLGPRIPEQCFRTREYLRKAVEHLDRGCDRHFLRKGSR